MPVNSRTHTSVGAITAVGSFRFVWLNSLKLNTGRSCCTWRFPPQHRPGQADSHPRCPVRSPSSRCVTRRHHGNGRGGTVLEIYDPYIVYQRWRIFAFLHDGGAYREFDIVTRSPLFVPVKYFNNTAALRGARAFAFGRPPEKQLAYRTVCHAGNEGIRAQLFCVAGKPEG